MDSHDPSHVHSASLSIDIAAEHGTSQLQDGTPDRTGNQPRRTSTLSYQDSGARDSDDRTYSWRDPTNLVVVIPPPDLPLNRWQLGSVLSMGPRHRLSQGILMQLYPSMFAQLNAIAREYNFPSTVGLCLYLHVNENGIKLTPRISHDSWQYLFAHLFDGRLPPSGQRLPIGGSIEFDIDLNKAHWFDTWISGTLRESEQVFPPVVTSQSLSEARWRGEGLTINVDEQPIKDRWNASASHMRPEALYHSSKKISVMDRLELYDVHIPPRSQDHPDHPGSPTHGTFASSPILKPAIPQSSESDLEHRVNSWKATTELYSASMAETYQPTPDVGLSAGMTTMDEYALECDFWQSISVDGFLGSMASVGPSSPDTDSPAASSRPSLVRLDRREIKAVVYPSSEIYPACTAECTAGEDVSQPVSVALNESNNSLTCCPSLVIYPPSPHPDIHHPVAEGMKTKGSSQVDTDMPPPVSVSTLYPNLAAYPVVFPKAVQVTETPRQGEMAVKLVNVSCLTAEYPNLTIYPNAYPFLEIYPPRDMRRQAPGVAWGISFGWLTAKTWLQVYPLHVAGPLTTERRIDDQSRSVLGPGSQIPAIVDIVVRKQAVWGSSFGWESATTWRAVWPTSYARIRPNVKPISTYLAQQSGSSTDYSYLTICPATYSHVDIYPSHIAISKVEESQSTKEDQFTINLIHYPNLVIYPVVYPHFDLYPALARVCPTVEDRKEGPELHYHIKTRGARAAARVGPNGLADDHTSEVDELLRLDLANHTWSQTSARPCTLLLGSLDQPFIPESVHRDHHTRRSVLSTLSTVTTLDTQDDNQYAEMNSIVHVSFPDHGRRVLDDIENIEFPQRPWRMVWPFLVNASQMKAPPSAFEQPIFETEHPHLIIDPPASPHTELYSTGAGVSTFGNQVIETSIYSSIYPIVDIYPAVYPHFNLYPATDLQIEIPANMVSNVAHRLVEVRLASLYPNFDIYHACYPYNLYYIYPPINLIETGHVPVEASCSCQSSVISEISRLVEPEQSPAICGWKSVDVKLPIRYPLLDLYPAVYPFVQLYPDSVHIPGVLDEGEYKSAKAFLALPEPIDPESAGYPYFNPPMLVRQQGRAIQDADVGGLGTLPQTYAIARRQRKTHMELHASVLRFLEKQPARSPKTHSQLHTEVFQDGIVWSPSGYMQDLSSLISRREDVPVPGSQQHRPPQDNSTPRPSRSRSVTTTAQSPDKFVFPTGQPPALPLISPLRVRSPATPSQPSLAVSETPMPRVSSSTNTYSHTRTRSARFTQAVKSMLPGGRRGNSSVTIESPPSSDVKELSKGPQSPTRFLSLVDRRLTVVPYTNTSESQMRSPRNSTAGDDLVSRQARARERRIANQPSGTVGTKGTHSPFR